MQLHHLRRYRLNCGSYTGVALPTTTPELRSITTSTTESGCNFIHWVGRSVSLSDAGLWTVSSPSFPKSFSLES